MANEAKLTNRKPQKVLPAKKKIRYKPTKRAAPSKDNARENAGRAIHEQEVDQLLHVAIETVKLDSTSCGNEAIANLLRKEQEKVCLDQEGKERLAIQQRQMEQELEEMRNHKSEEVDAAMKTVRECCERKRQAQVEALEKQMQARLRAFVRTMKALNQETIADRKCNLEKELRASVEREERQLRDELELEMERHAEMQQVNWKEEKERRVTERRRHFADIRSRMISQKKMEFDKEMRCELDRLDSEHEQQLSAEIETLNHDHESKRQCRISCLRERLAADRESRINRVRAEYEADLGRQMASIERDNDEQLAGEIQRLKRQLEERANAAVRERSESCRQANDKAIQELKDDQQRELHRRCSDKEDELKTEHAANKRQITIQHAAELNRCLRSIQAELDLEHDAQLHKAITQANGLLTTMETLARRFFEMKRERATRDQACRTCRKLLAYNAEILSNQLSFVE